MVYEHDLEEEILSDKEQSVNELQFLLEYEVYGSWWGRKFLGTWLQGWMERYFAEKVRYKWKKYKTTKMLSDVDKS